MANKSAAAGGRNEAWLAKYFKKRGWHSDRLRSFQVEGEPDLYATKAGFLFEIQAKERQNLNVHKTLMDLIEGQATVWGRIDSDEGRWNLGIPLVVYKHMEKRGDTGRRTQVGPIMASLPLDDFCSIVEQVQGADEILTQIRGLLDGPS